jgi:flagellar basal-body rod protein FlgG
MVFKELPAMRIRRINDGKLYPPRPIYKYPRIGKIGTGAIVDETYTRWDAGSTYYTGNNLDVSLDNEKAFFIVESKNGTRYSRDGSWKVDDQGYLVDSGGDYILGEVIGDEEYNAGVLYGEDGALTGRLDRIQVDNGHKCTIDEEGRVVVDNEARFRVVTATPSDRSAFRKEGNNNFVRAYGEVTRADTNFLPGYLEKPNFSVVEEMVKMIEISRAYEANSKVVQSHDNLLDKCINSVGATRR